MATTIKSTQLDFDFIKNLNEYPIYFFKTDTSGEKSYEEFYSSEDECDLETYNSLGFIITKNIEIPFHEVKNDFDKIFSDIATTKNDIVKVIKKYVPDFKHSEKGKHLDQKM